MTERRDQMACQLIDKFPHKQFHEWSLNKARSYASDNDESVVASRDSAQGHDVGIKAVDAQYERTKQKERELGY